MSRIAIHQPEEAVAVEVDLWADNGGGLFKTRPVTRSVAQKIDAAQQKLEQAVEGEDPDQDEQVKLLGQFLDVVLVSPNGTKASTLIVKKWKADELTVPELWSFAERLREASEERPT